MQESPDTCSICLLVLGLQLCSPVTGCLCEFWDPNSDWQELDPPKHLPRPRLTFIANRLCRLPCPTLMWKAKCACLLALLCWEVHFSLPLFPPFLLSVSLCISLFTVSVSLPLPLPCPPLLPPSSLFCPPPCYLPPVITDHRER